MEAKRIPHGGPVAGDEKDVRMYPRRAQLRTLATILALVALVGMQASSALGAVQPAPAFDAGPSAAVTPLPACTTADALAPFSLYSQWASTFIDTRYRVTSTYVPPVLVSTANAGTNGGYLVRRLVIDDLGAMFRAAKRAGVTIRVAAAYRSYAQQRTLYQALVARVGATQAALQGDRPGHSEHQLGTALDMSNTHGAYSWLAANAWRYGFVNSYPLGGRSVSCHAPEPGHVRYVGRTRAAAIHASGLVPRAWLWTYVASPATFSVSPSSPLLYGYGTKDYLAFTFTSTSPARRQGLARFVMPTQTFQAFTTAWGPALQTSHPGNAGYFRADASTCASAGVAGFTASAANVPSQQSIDVSFDCQPGQAFILHWFPNVVPVSGWDVWTFPLSTRSAATQPWTPQHAGLPTVDVSTPLINLPPLEFVTPPVKVIDIQQTAPAGDPPMWVFQGAGEITGAKVNTTIQGGVYYRVDTGALVTLENPDNLRVSRELTVKNCVDLNAGLVTGVDTPPGVLPVNLDCAAVAQAAKIATIPANTFKNLDGSCLSGQVSVLFRVSFAGNNLSDWNATNVECRWKGGVLSTGSPGVLWACSLPITATLAQYNDAVTDLKAIQFCPTGTIDTQIYNTNNRYVVCTD